jgi:hypothetical protein
MPQAGSFGNFPHIHVQLDFLSTVKFGHNPIGYYNRPDAATASRAENQIEFNFSHFSQVSIAGYLRMQPSIKLDK